MEEARGTFEKRRRGIGGRPFAMASRRAWAGFLAGSLALIALSALLLFVVLPGCGQKEPARPNVVLIVIDTLRPDHLPFYGYRHDTAPFLARLADEGVVFEHVHSTSSWTAPATTSILTSLHPLQHGVHNGTIATRERSLTDPTITIDRIPDDARTAAEAFREAGYATWAVSDNFNVSRAMGFDQGFDRFEEMTDQGGDEVNAVVREWASELRAKPYFLYLHYMDPHRPYLPRMPYFRPGPTERENSIGAYDSEIHFVDDRIRELYDLLEWGKNAWVVVCADHGEEFLDHGAWDHGRTLYAEVLHVPLIIHPPTPLPAGSSAKGAPAPGPIKRITQQATLLDVLPTLREMGHVPGGDMEQGISLLSAVYGEQPRSGGRTFFAELHSAPWYGSQTLKCVIQANHKYILTLPSAEELYDIMTDPREQRSVAAQRPRVMEMLRRELDLFEASRPRLAADTASTTLDPQTIEKLRSLGYIK